jgi:TolA-binding protein
MRIQSFLAAAALTGLALTVGCNTGEQLRKVEREVGDLKLEVFKLRQQMEEANKRAEADHTATTESRNMDRRFQADLQETLRQLQESTRILNTKLSDPARAGALPRMRAAAEVAGQPATSEDEKAFAVAVLDYNRGNYAIAADSLELFLKSSPSSPKRPDALFFLGLSYYNQKAFDKAQSAFDRILKEHSSSAQFLPAKLKRGQSLLKLGLKPAAVKAFKEISEGFPGTPEARTAQQELADLGF